MAYMNRGSCPGGPYPNKAGEYCGNHHKDNPLTEDEYATKRFGCPRPCKAGTTKEMEAAGYIGLYLKEDRPLVEWMGEVECPTPPELLEPLGGI